MSKKTDEYLAKLQGLEAQAPGEYQSKYQGQIDAVTKAIQGRKGLNYDFNADPLYHQYKDQYTKLGNEAAMNAAAAASALTGGYGNSYAATAASQANQQYLTQLNGIIPELARAAQERYDTETAELYRQAELLGNQDATAYGRARDAVADYQTNRNYYYDLYAGSVAEDQWQDTFDYQKAQDAQAQQNWQTQFDYQQQQDQQSQANWQSQFDYQRAQDEVARQQWQDSFDYQKSQDALSQQNWQTQFDYQKQQDAQAQANWEAQQAYQAALDAQSQANWQAEFDYKKGQEAARLAAQKAAAAAKSSTNNSTNPNNTNQTQTTQTGDALKLAQTMYDGGKSDAFIATSLSDKGYTDQQIADALNKVIDEDKTEKIYAGKDKNGRAIYVRGNIALN